MIIRNEFEGAGVVLAGGTRRIKPETGLAPVNKEGRKIMSNNGKTAVVEYTGRLDDGTIFDTTEGMEPLEYVVGSGAVIHGFDEAVARMELGETLSVSVPPREAYGEYDESKIELGPMYAIPGAKDLQVGKTFYFITEEGLRFPAVITEINEGIARIDYNHPLAGKTLNFDIKLLELKDEASTNIDMGIPLSA